MYDVNSKCADDFINHEEILETLAYADENKENIELIDSIIEKAMPMKTKKISNSSTRSSRRRRREKGSLTGKHPYCSPVLLRKRIRKSISWQNRSRKISTETES